MSPYNHTLKLETTDYTHIKVIMEREKKLYNDTLDCRQSQACIT